MPLNAKPVDATTFAHDGAEPGKEQCFVVRSVADRRHRADRERSVESDLRDAARHLRAGGAEEPAGGGIGAGVVNLIWDANTEADLAGYLVLRGEAPGDRLQPLTPEPIKETRYQDRSVRAGVTYVYVIVAVDRATPPNRSAESNRVQETAR